MTLQIDPQTEKGQTQIETIKWCQDQMNEVARQFFNDRYRLLKGIRFEFKIPLDGNFDETIKVNVAELAPTDEKRFNEGIEEARQTLGFKKPEEPVATIVDQKFEGEKNGINKE